MSKKRRIGDKLEKENDVEDAKGAAAAFFLEYTKGLRIIILSRRA